MLCNSSICRSSRLLTAPVLTSTGGLFYDVHGVSRTGTPRGHARGGVPVFGSAPVKSVRRAASAKRCVAALAHLHLVGPTLPLPLSRTAGARRARLEDTAQETASICACRTRARRVARRGGGAPTFGATDKAKNKPRPDLAKMYGGRAMREAAEKTMRGSFGPGGYALPSGIGRQAQSNRQSSRSCTFGHGNRPDFHDCNSLESRGQCEESQCIPGAWVD